jgi:hypothetical protein
VKNELKYKIKMKIEMEKNGNVKAIRRGLPKVLT